MSDTIRKRIGAPRAVFEPGEEMMLALSLATADLGALFTRVFDAHGLSHMQYNALRMLAGAGDSGLTHGEITRRLIQGVPDVTRMMDRLEREGLVDRARSEQDRRRVVHRITPQGRKLLGRIAPELERLHRGIEETFGERTRRDVVRACSRVIEAVAGGLMEPEGGKR